MRGAIFAMRVVSVFGGAWLLWAAFATPATPHWLALVAVCATGLLLGLSVPLARRAAEPEGGSARAAYRPIVFGELAAVIIAAVLLGRSGAAVWIGPAIATIVALHFFPLARLLRLRRFGYAGALMLIGTAASVLLWPPATAHASQIVGQGVLMAAVLYGTAAMALRSARG